MYKNNNLLENNDDIEVLITNVISFAFVYLLIGFIYLYIVDFYEYKNKIAKKEKEKKEEEKKENNFNEFYKKKYIKYKYLHNKLKK